MNGTQYFMELHEKKIGKKTIVLEVVDMSFTRMRH